MEPDTVKWVLHSITASFNCGEIIIKTLLSILLVIALCLGMIIESHAVLIDRGTGMIYDTDLGITWLQDANYAQTSGYDTNGLMSWAQAMTWAHQLVFGGYSNWRLPSPLNPDGTGPDSGYEVTSSEMGHLYYTVMGNPAGGPVVNTGPFVNVQANMYWSNMHHSTISDRAWSFSFVSGAQDYTLDYQQDQRAWAVMDGDFGPSVSETSSYVMDPMLLGSSLSFQYWWDMGIDPPPYQQGYMFDVLALQGGAGWQYIGQIDAYGSSTGWNTASFLLPVSLIGTETQIRFVLNDYFPDTDPTVYLRDISTAGTAPVPEPSTMLLLGSGLAGLVAFRRRFRN